jgi:hypothetical protein
MKIITKRQAKRQLMIKLKDAYKDMCTIEPIGDDYDAASQATGLYDGLKLAYIILTGRSAADVANEVTGWFITTPEYQASKENPS